MALSGWLPVTTIIYYLSGNHTTSTPRPLSRPDFSRLARCSQNVSVETLTNCGNATLRMLDDLSHAPRNSVNILQEIWHSYNYDITKVSKALPTIFSEARKEIMLTSTIFLRVSVVGWWCRDGAPPYMTSQFTRVADMSNRQRPRSASSNQLDVPSFRLSTVGSRAFPIAGAKVWNSLPDDVTSVLSLSTYRRHLKTYLFSCCYNTDWYCLYLLWL